MRKVLKFYSLYKRKRYNKIYDDDIFIVSYPKSGNTWVRFILANILNNNKVRIDFNSAIKYIPEYQVHDEEVSKLKRPRLLKSHQLFNTKFPRVVYLVRDPRDVYVSYFFYLKKKLPKGYTIKDFIKSDIKPSRWSAHVGSWLGHQNIILVKYEDLIENTFNEINRIVDFIGWEVEPETISEAVARSSFKRMSWIEDKYGRPFRSEEDKEKATKFVRKGVIGDWNRYYDEEILEYIYVLEGEIMRKLKYI